MGRKIPVCFVAASLTLGVSGISAQAQEDVAGGPGILAPTPQPPARPGNLAGMPGRAFLPNSPEMGKKTKAIMGLRLLLEIRLTAKDINTILPPLRELRNAERGYISRAEQALEEEKKALLEAGPDDDVPPGSGLKMDRERVTYEIKQQEVWNAVGKSLGREKTGPLRRLVGQGNPDNFMRPGMPGGDFFVPDNGNFPGKPPNGLPGAGNPDGSGNPPGPGGNRPARPRRPGQPGGEAPAALPQVPPGADAVAAEAPVALALTQEPVQPPLPQGGGDTLIRPAVPGIGQTIPQGPRPGGPDRLRGTRQNQNFPRGQIAQTMPGGGMNFFGGPILTVSELVDLLEQKLAAMRK